MQWLWTYWAHSASHLSIKDKMSSLTVWISNFSHPLFLLIWTLRFLKLSKEVRLNHLSKASNRKEYVIGLNIHGNYLKPSLLEHMIWRHGDDRLKEIMRDYMSNLQHYHEVTKLTTKGLHVHRKRKNPDHSVFAANLRSRWKEKPLK